MLSIARIELFAPMTGPFVAVISEILSITQAKNCRWKLKRIHLLILLTKN